MLAVALTGGIGSGKSSFARLLVAKGAVLIDSDEIAHAVVEPGGPAYEAVAGRFGEVVVGEDGRIDRAALARIVFADPAARADLEAAVHPAVGAEIVARLRREAEGDHVVVVDIPLLTELARPRAARSPVLPPIAAVLVVDAPVEVARARLVDQRGMAPAEADARIAAQASREERVAAADLVIDNGGSRAALAAEADRAWGWIQGLRR